jgi:DNA polymerase III delta subunit
VLYLIIIKNLEPVLVQQTLEEISLKDKGPQKVVYLSDVKSFEQGILIYHSPTLFEDNLQKTIFILTNVLFEKIQKTGDLPIKNIKIIKVNSINLKQFPFWLESYFKKSGYSITPKIKQSLCDYFEGNVSAVYQCIEKLKLKTPKGVLTEEQVFDMLIPSARYTIFDLLDKLTVQDCMKIPVILQSLEEEGVEPILVLWGLAKKCREKQMPHLLPMLVKADRMIKGNEPGRCWDFLLQIALLFAQRSLI